MDETEPTSAPASTTRDRLAGIIWSATRAKASLLAMLMACCILLLLPLIPSIIRGETSGGEIVFFALLLAVIFLFFFALEVVLPAFMEWVRRVGQKTRAEHHKKRRAKKFAALGEAHKAPFHLEQRCKLSPSEEVWVRRARNPQSNQVSLEVLHTGDGGQTWQRLPLRLSPWAKFKCIVYQGEWPATSRTRHLSWDKVGISFEVLDLCADNWETWPIVWRATYRPRWKWWTLKVIGPPLPGMLSGGTGTLPADPSSPR